MAYSSVGDAGFIFGFPGLHLMESRSSDPLEILLAEEELQHEMFHLGKFHVNKLIGEIKNAKSAEVVSVLEAKAEAVLIAMRDAFTGNLAFQHVLGLADDLAIVVTARKDRLAKQIAAGREAPSVVRGRR